MAEYVDMKLQKMTLRNRYGGTGKTSSCTIYMFTLTLMVNFEFGKNWSTVTTFSKLSYYKKGTNSQNSPANSEFAGFLDQETSRITCRMNCGNNVVWLKPWSFLRM